MMKLLLTLQAWIILVSGNNEIIQNIPDPEVSLQMDPKLYVFLDFFTF